MSDDNGLLREFEKHRYCYVCGGCQPCGLCKCNRVPEPTGIKKCIGCASWTVFGAFLAMVLAVDAVLLLVWYWIEAGF